MNVKTTEIAKVELNQMERNILATSCEILAKFHKEFEHVGDAELMSIETGEVINLADVRRAIGVLDGIKYSRFWEVQED